MKQYLNIGIYGYEKTGKTALSEAFAYFPSLIKKEKNSSLDALIVKLNEVTGTNIPEETFINTKVITDVNILIIDSRRDINTEEIKLFNVLKNTSKPLFIFLNYLDLIDEDNKESIIENIRTKLSKDIYLSSKIDYEEIAQIDEEAFEEYINGNLSIDTIYRLILESKLYLAYFGCAIHGDGLSLLITSICEILTGQLVEKLNISFKLSSPVQVTKLSPVNNEEKLSKSPKGNIFEQDKELQRIYEMTYGKIDNNKILSQKEKSIRENEINKPIPKRILIPAEDTYILIDGYNLLFAWEELTEIAKKDLSVARDLLCEILCNYQGYKKEHIILVFDAYKVSGGSGSVSEYKNIKVVYTREAQTADAYIEKATFDIARDHLVKVVSSDSAEQLIIMGHGAKRIPAREFKSEIINIVNEINNFISLYNSKVGNYKIKDAIGDAIAKNRR